MAKRLSIYGPAAALFDGAEISAFLADKLETSDAAFIAKARATAPHAAATRTIFASSSRIAIAAFDRS